MKYEIYIFVFKNPDSTHDSNVTTTLAEKGAKVNVEEKVDGQKIRNTLNEDLQSGACVVSGY